MIASVSMPCRKCGGVLGVTEGKSEFYCAHCHVTYEDADDAIGDPWDDPDDLEPLDFNK